MGVLVRVGGCFDVIESTSGTVSVSVGTSVGEERNLDGVNVGANVVMRVRGNVRVNVGGNVDINDCVVVGVNV